MRSLNVPSGSIRKYIKDIEVVVTLEDKVTAQKIWFSNVNKRLLEKSTNKREVK